MNPTRQIVLDTETTGKNPQDGHRILEIGAIEILDGKVTNNFFHVYINPERHIDEEVVAIHGIDNEKVKDSPKFAEIADGLIEFIKDSEVFIHNADFDIRFLNSELDRVQRGNVWDHVKKITCTLKMARSYFPTDRRFSLDKLCEKFAIDNTQRTFHGALLDSQLLAEVLFKMQENAPSAEALDVELKNWKRPEIKPVDTSKLNLIVTELNEEDLKLHEAFLAGIEKKTHQVPAWKRPKA